MPQVQVKNRGALSAVSGEVFFQGLKKGQKVNIIIRIATHWWLVFPRDTAEVTQWYSGIVVQCSGMVVQR